MPSRLCVLVILAAVGCRAPSPSTPRSVTDDLGRTVQVPERILRVVSIAPSVTETVFAAGAGHLLVGVTDADDYPPAVGSIARIQALPLNREALVELRPDLIVASDQVNDPRDAQALAGLGIATWFVRVETLDDIPRSIRALGSLLGTEEEAGRFADSLETLRRELLAGSSMPEGSETANGSATAPGIDGVDTGRKPTVLILVGDRSLFSFGRGSYAHDLVALAGGRSLTADLTTRAPVLSDEFVLDAAPDVIVGTFGPDYDPSRLLEAHPTWTHVPAIANGAVFSVNPDHVLRPGPRLFQGALDIAKALKSLDTTP